jgi:hypothetical protein
LQAEAERQRKILEDKERKAAAVAVSANSQSPDQASLTLLQHNRKPRVIGYEDADEGDLIMLEDYQEESISPKLQPIKTTSFPESASATKSFDQGGGGNRHKNQTGGDGPKYYRLKVGPKITNDKTIEFLTSLKGIDKIDLRDLLADNVDIIREETPETVTKNKNFKSFIDSDPSTQYKIASYTARNKRIMDKILNHIDSVRAETEAKKKAAGVQLRENTGRPELPPLETPPKTCNITPNDCNEFYNRLYKLMSMKPAPSSEVFESIYKQLITTPVCSSFNLHNGTIKAPDDRLKMLGWSDKGPRHNQTFDNTLKRINEKIYDVASSTMHESADKYVYRLNMIIIFAINSSLAHSSLMRSSVTYDHTYSIIYHLYKIFIGVFEDKDVRHIFYINIFVNPGRKQTTIETKPKTYELIVESKTDIFLDTNSSKELNKFLGEKYLPPLEPSGSARPASSRNVKVPSELSERIKRLGGGGGSHTRKKPRMKSKINTTRRRFTKEKLRKTIRRISNNNLT